MFLRIVTIAILIALATGCGEEEQLRQLNEVQQHQIEQQSRLVTGLIAAQAQSACLVAENKTIRSAQSTSNTALVITGCGLAVALFVLLRRRPGNAS